MSTLNTILSDAVTAGDVPFVVAMAGKSTGITWSGAAGERAPGVAATEDTVFRIYSMTKAIGSAAAMILIDRNKLSPDSAVEEILPQFANISFLDGFDGDTPRLRAPKLKATVRHLATHTAGFVYETWNAEMAKYAKAAGHPAITSGLKAALYSPLVFEAGERWDYGIGIDWLGQIVEAVDGRRIDRFCREEIFDPLGMPDTSFEVTDRLADRLAVVNARGEDGQFTGYEMAPPSNPELYGMGYALYSTAPDYMRFLRMFLNSGQLDDSRILSEAAVERMLTNHIGELRVGKMITNNPALTADVELFPGLEKSHSLGFLRMEEDVPGMRAAGSQGWAGMLNTHYWFDPARDVAGIIMTQTLPFVEPRFMHFYELFERALYAEAQ